MQYALIFLSIPLRNLSSDALWIMFNSLSHSIDDPPDLPLTVSAEVMHIEKLNIPLTSELHHLISLGSEKQ